MKLALCIQIAVYDCTLAYIDSEVVEFPEFAEAVGDARDVLGRAATSVGQKAPRFAPWRGSFFTTYTHPETVNLGGGISGDRYTRGDLYYTGERYLTLVNIGESASSVVANLRTGLVHSPRRHLFDPRRGNALAHSGGKWIAIRKIRTC